MPGPGMMTFQAGPQHFCTEEHARAMGYKRWKPGDPDPKHQVTAHKRQASMPPKPAPSPLPARQKMPPPPERHPKPPVYMAREEMHAERERLEVWMVKVAAIDKNAADLAAYNEVKYRADELYVLESMSR